MKYNLSSLIAVSLLMISCTVQKKNTENNEYEVKLDTLTFFDHTRNRTIPVAFYYPKTDKKLPISKSLSSITGMVLIRAEIILYTLI